MNELAIILNVLGIYGRACHNLTTGKTFIPDHEIFAEIYSFAEDSYDSVIERCLGLGIDINIQQINLQAATMCSQITIGDSNEEKFAGVNEILSQTNSMIDDLSNNGGLSSGTVQLIGDISNQFEVFQYKIKQRLSD